MARVPYLDREDLAEEDRPLLDRNINLFRALAHNPKAARAFGGLGGYIRHKSGLDGRLRELAILQVGYLARSEYEYSHHVKIGFEFGLSEDDVRAIATETEGGTSGLEPLARLVLRTAREMTLDGAASQATYAELEEHFDRATIIDLFMAIAFYNGVVRLLGSLEIDVENSYREYLERFPLPGN